MIQRIQTVFLLLAVLVALGWFLFAGSFADFHIVEFALSVALALGAALALTAIFLYKNRKRQIAICTVAVIMFCIAVAAGLYNAVSFGKISAACFSCAAVILLSLIHI